jgi:DNA-binding transcriptional MerR regulator
MGTATASPEDRPPTSVGDPPASLSEAEVARPRRTWLIGEIADLTGVTRRALRHYDELGLLVPSARTDSDYRVYDEADLQRLLQVQNLKSLGLRLPEIAAALADASTDATASLVLHREALERRIEQERRLAERLGLLAGQSERSWQDVLAAIALSQRLASPDPVVRLRAALESPGTPADLFGALVAEAEPAVQEVLLWALAQRPAAVATALEHLDHPDAHHRWLMARLLGELGDPVAAAPLLGLLDDPDPAVATAAVAALGQVGDAVAVPALIGLLAEPSVPEPVLTDALARFGPAAVAPLVEALRTGAAPVRERAADLLGRLGEVAAANPLAAALTDPDPAVLVAAALALGALGEPGRAALATVAADPELGPLARRLL